MNIFDRVYEAFSPERALRRAASRMQLERIKSIRNSGYDESGASTTKRSLKGWKAESKEPFDDIDRNLHVLRQRSRSLFMNAPIATSAIKTTRTNVIGSGLRLKSRIDFKLLGISQDEADRWERKVEQEFNLWAESKFCDALGLNNFYELQQVAMISWLLNGDSFTLIRHLEPRIYMPYGLRLHLVEGDRVSNPKAPAGYLNADLKAKNGNRILNGVEVNKLGEVVAYHLCNTHPSSTRKKEWQRVQAIGQSTGLPNILHVMEAERPEQYRGVPYLAPVIESLKQMTRYTEAELTAAVINGFFTVFITSDSPQDMDEEFSGIGQEDGMPNETADYQLGAGMINMLGPGEKIEVADPKRPNVNFDGFVSALCKYVGAALEIPYELLIKSFTASYSASRAALMEAWKAFKMRRSWFATDFCQPVYEVWLSEAVGRGRINAPGFFSDPLIKKAYCGSEWNGPAPGQLDPMKEVNAAAKRIELGLSTREREAIEINSSDFDRNIEQLKLEQGKMRELAKEGE